MSNYRFLLKLNRAFYYLLTTYINSVKFSGKIKIIKWLSNCMFILILQLTF